MVNESLIPLPGYALVRLSKKYESGLSVEKEKYATNSQGVLVSYQHSKESIDRVPLTYKDNVSLYDGMLKKTVYFTPFEDGEIIKYDGAEYVFVPVEQLRGGKQ